MIRTYIIIYFLFQQSYDAVNIFMKTMDANPSRPLSTVVKITNRLFEKFEDEIENKK